MSVEREKGKSELWKERRDSLEKGWREREERDFVCQAVIQRDGGENEL